MHALMCMFLICLIMFWVVVGNKKQWLHKRTGGAAGFFVNYCTPSVLNILEGVSAD